MNKMKIDNEIRICYGILLLLILCLAVATGGMNERLNSQNETLQELTQLNSTQNITCEKTDLGEVRKDISNIKFECPSLSCPKYTPAECSSTILNNDNLLMLDKFVFRYEEIKMNYYKLEHRLGDKDDRVYCNENIDEIREEYKIASTYISEYYTKTKFGKDSKEKVAYDILVSANGFFKDYLIELRDYCVDTVSEVEKESYDKYEAYLVYYNDLRNESTLPNMEVLRYIDTE